MENMEIEGTHKKGIVLPVILGATFLVVMVGATFAYFSANAASTEQKITTSNMNLTVALDGSATHISDIKPTKWDTTLATNDANADIAKVPFVVTSSSTATGTYKVKLGTTSAITLNSGNDEMGNALVGGAISDIKYRLYTSDGTPVGTEGSFSAAMGTAANYVEITTGNISETLSDKYVLYVYIAETTAEQNKLQGIDFTVAINGSAQQ